MDDTTVSEVVANGGLSRAQAIANRVIEWSRKNRVQTNAYKCKEIRISFAKEQRVFDAVIIHEKTQIACTVSIPESPIQFLILLV